MDLDPRSDKALEAGEIARILVTLSARTAVGPPYTEFNEELERLVLRDDWELTLGVILALATFGSVVVHGLAEALAEGPEGPTDEDVEQLLASICAALAAQAGAW